MSHAADIHKAQTFEGEGLQVVRLSMLPVNNVSGSHIRECINKSSSTDELAQNLRRAGFMPQAISGLIRTLEMRQDA